jgi:hypothetical protein
MGQAATPLITADLLVDRAIERAPRLAMLAMILFAWALTLAWPPPASDARPLVQGQTGLIAGYPLRVEMPTAQRISIDELAIMAERHPVIASLGIELPNREDAPIESQSFAPVRASGDFASAFSDLLDPVAGRARDQRAAAAITSAEGLKPGQFMDLDYDLAKLTPTEGEEGSEASSSAARYNAQDGSLTVTKPLLVDGQSRGDATIRIEEGAQILIATTSVANALGSKVDSLPRRVAGALASGSGFIPFHELRGAGIAVEYDPVTDRVSLSMPS